MYNILYKLSNLLFENTCLICNKGSKELNICSPCVNSFKERKENSSKYFDNLVVYSWGYYEGKLRDGILNLKNGKKKLAKFFGVLLGRFWKTLEINGSILVVPVPSHKSRIKERGYCQATLIAKYFSDYLPLRFSNNVLKRVKNTTHMNALSNINERRTNIKDAFSINHKAISTLNYQIHNLLIIDDILTSGNTMCEIEKTIHRYNPNIKTIGLTIASGDTW